ncbi:hypothetical protein LTR12_006864 [Friedmanniomyces endolithicus]|nr:hypothetical protein LTR74_012333 [Friedmanniomyces endolithicus]KAK1818679.1 hypothetical protein LTR12_006864 [Friedmanniomyces endolithicus]
MQTFGLDDMMTGLDNSFPGLWTDIDFGTISGSGDLSGLVTPAESIVPPNAKRAMEIMMEWTTAQRTSQQQEGLQDLPFDWCSAIPDPRMYDLDVLEIWVDIAVRCIGTLFPVFKNFQVDEGTTDALYVAMAAVGGVYCNVENSFHLAKVMFNDARRLALALPFRNGNLSIEASLSLCKTFVLLEIYGIVSGDKRSFDFADVFHADLLQVVRHLLNASAAAQPEERRDPEIQL